MPTAIPESKKLVPIREAAIFLGVSIDTIRRWDKNGILKAERPEGKTRYFLLEDLEKIKSSKKIGISEASRLLKVSQSTLRRFESRNLIKPERGKNGERLYNSDDLEALLSSRYFIRQRQVTEEEANVREESKKEETKQESVEENVNQEFIPESETKPRSGLFEFAVRIGISVVIFSILVNFGFRNIYISANQFQEISTGQEVLSETEEISPTPTPIESDIESTPTPQVTPEAEREDGESEESIITVVLPDSSSLLNIRKAPSTDSPIIGKAKKGETFEFISRDSGWYQIKLEDGIGYVSEEFALD